MKHKWSITDDIIALYIYKFSTDYIPYDQQKVASVKGIPSNSLKMRISNFMAIDTGHGLDHFAKQSKFVYEKFNNYKESDLRRLAFSELG